jgi:hypothetical protein
MKTTTAYLAGLGTTGILIGSILVVLALGSGVMAFDALPEQRGSSATLGRVVIKDEARGARGERAARAVRAGRVERARREPRRRG